MLTKKFSVCIINKTVTGVKSIVSPGQCFSKFDEHCITQDHAKSQILIRSGLGSKTWCI